MAADALGPWLGIVRRLIDFSDMRLLERWHEGCEVELVDPWLTEGTKFITVRFCGSQYVYDAHDVFDFVAARVEKIGATCVATLVDADGNENMIDVMIWLQYMKQQETMEWSLRCNFPAQSFYTLFNFHQAYTQSGGLLYTNVVMRRPVTALDGRAIASADVLFVNAETQMIVFKNGATLPAPQFRVTSASAPDGCWLGVGIRGGHGMSGETLARVRDFCEARFGRRLYVVPLDVNAAVRPCEACCGPAPGNVACCCAENIEVLADFAFVSHVCLVHNDVSEPYTALAAALWHTVPRERALCAEFKGGNLKSLTEVLDGAAAGASGTAGDDLLVAGVAVAAGALPGGPAAVAEDEAAEDGGDEAEDGGDGGSGSGATARGAGEGSA